MFFWDDWVCLVAKTGHICLEWVGIFCGSHICNSHIKFLRFVYRMFGIFVWDKRAYLWGGEWTYLFGMSGHIWLERVVISVWDESAYLFGMSGHMCLGWVGIFVGDQWAYSFGLSGPTCLGWVSISAWDGVRDVGACLFGMSGHICLGGVRISLWDEWAYSFGMSGHICLK